MPILQLRKASLAFGHVPLLDDVELIVEAHERVCLVGRNGAGKSSLLKVLNGTHALDSGELRIDSGRRVSFLVQEVPEGIDQSIYATVASGLGDLSTVLARYHALSHQVSLGEKGSLARLSEVQTQIDELGAWDDSNRVESVISRLALDGDALMSESSGGIRRRALLGQALVSEPDLLLLDEPTNHLDIESIQALEAAVTSYAGAVIFVTHDRSFIDKVATRIVELDRGQLNSYPGSYAEYQTQKALEQSAQDERDRKFDQRLAEEERWIRQGIKARRTRNEGRVRRLKKMRQERAQRLDRQGQVKLRLDSANPSGQIVIKTQNLGVSFGDQLVIENFSTTIVKGDRVGVIGPNGSGKSTLLKALLGELVPTQGVVELGTNLEIAYFDQDRLQLDPEATVRDSVVEGTDVVQIGDVSKHVVGYLRDFLFPPERVRSPVKSLSGGERNRLLLAKLFAKPANLLVLDEPTNDLDVETLELLEELLGEYNLTLILVSHDRAFLDQTVTSTLVLEGAGRVGEYVGGYSDWLRQADQSQSSPNKPPREKQEDSRGKAAVSRRPEKLSYNEERELAQLPARIEQLESVQAQLSEETSEPEFYRQDQSLIEDRMQALAQITAELEEAYNRWAELEDKQTS
ncbi:MAG: ATP-binding cassette domain-containing protein [Pseudomonadota bacterium]